MQFVSISPLLGGGVCSIRLGTSVLQDEPIFPMHLYKKWHAVTQLVDALRYKLTGRGFDFRRCHWNFSLTSSFRPHYGHRAHTSSNRNENQQRRPARRADSLTTLMCRLSWNLGVSASWNPQGLSRQVMGLLYLSVSLYTREWYTTSQSNNTPSSLRGLDRYIPCA
jgi:hypothetical protein